MFRLIEKAFIVLVSFSGSLIVKCMSLNNKKCKSRLTLINLQPIELKYYLFMVGLNKFNGIFNFADDLSTKICAPNKIKSVNVKLFYMAIKISEAKSLIKHISSDIKFKFNSTTCKPNLK